MSESVKDVLYVVMPAYNEEDNIEKVLQQLEQPQIAEIADISPICSIIVAIAIGAITKMAVMSNLQSSNGGKPTHPADATFAKFKIAVPSGFVTPHRCNTSATA